MYIKAKALNINIRMSKKTVELKWLSHFTGNVFCVMKSQTMALLIKVDFQ